MRPGLLFPLCLAPCSASFALTRQFAPASPRVSKSATPARNDIPGGLRSPAPQPTLDTAPGSSSIRRQVSSTEDMVRDIRQPGLAPDAALSAFFETLFKLSADQLEAMAQEYFLLTGRHRSP